MPTPIKTDLGSMQRRLEGIISRALQFIEREQRKAKGAISAEERRALKTLSDVLSDQMKLQRQLSDDLEKFLEGLPEHLIEAIAEHRKDPTARARKAAQTTQEQPAGGPDASEKPSGEVGSEAQARGTGTD